MRRRRALLLALGTLCLLAALGLTVRDLHSEARARQTAAQTLDLLEPQISAAQPHAEPQPQTGASEPAPQTIPDYQLDPQRDMPVFRVDGIDYIGLLEIPALELRLPVAGTWSYEALAAAPCRYAGSVYLDDLVILAHNYRGFFRDLKLLHAGDAVRFTDADGNVFSYAVSDFEQLHPSQTEDMLRGNWDLTLFTCTVGGQDRLAVRCVRADDAESE